MCKDYEKDHTSFNAIYRNGFLRTYGELQRQ